VTVANTTTRKQKKGCVATENALGRMGVLSLEFWASSLWDLFRATLIASLDAAPGAGGTQSTTLDWHVNRGYSCHSYQVIPRIFGLYAREGGSATQVWYPQAPARTLRAWLWLQMSGPLSESICTSGGVSITEVNHFKG
jgi:hypothetical protein